MALFGNAKVVKLNDALAGKATELWDKSAFQAQNSEAYLQAAAQATATAQEAAKHAAAVEAALSILDEAGVTL